MASQSRVTGWRRAGLVAVAVAALAAAVLPGTRAVEALRATRALEGSHACAAGAHAACVRRVPVRLSVLSTGEDYPYPAISRTWEFVTVGGGTRGAFVASARTSHAIDTLGGPVTGLFYADHLLALESVSGHRVETAYAVQGPLRSGLPAAGLVALALLVGSAAAGVSRTVGWTLLAASGAGLVPVGIGAMPWTSLLAMAATLGAALVVIRRIRAHQEAAVLTIGS